MTIEEALRQNPSYPCPSEILASQIMLSVQFHSFKGNIMDGQIVVHKELAGDVRDLFGFLLKEGFPLASVIPVASPLFSWDDERSMAVNNSSGFNYRQATGLAKLSNHSLGRAIDINPLLNPYISKGVIHPARATYDPIRPGTIAEDSPIVSFLTSRGWRWGGHWTEPKDYHHFEKI